MLKMEYAQAMSCAYSPEQEIFALAEELFDTDQFSLQALKVTWLNRWHDPLQLKGNTGISGQVRALLIDWHRPEAYKRPRAQQSVSSNTLLVIYFCFTMVGKVIEGSSLFIFTWLIQCAVIFLCVQGNNP